MIRTHLILFLVSTCAVLCTSRAVAGEPPPEDRTYFIYVIGLDDDPLVGEADCLTFDATQACTLDGLTCLNWQRASGGVQSPKQSGFSMSAVIDDGELVVSFEGQGRVESLGRKTAIAAVGRAAALDASLNFSFAGRQTSLGKCRRRVEEFRAQSGDP